jgi:hypothetical protein
MFVEEILVTWLYYEVNIQDVQKLSTRACSNFVPIYTCLLYPHMKEKITKMTVTDN